MRVNIRSVAQAAGVSVATASRALRGLASVDAQTGARVCAVARKLGYVRDPLLASALTYARRPDKPIYRETMAFMAAVAPEEYHQFPWLEKIQAGLALRAAELGYGVELLRIPQEPRAQRLLGRQLRSRGVRGCVVCPVSPITESAPLRLDMDWSHLAGIEIGRALFSPILPRVIHNLADDLAVMMTELYRRGYRRLGLAVNRKDEETRRWAALSACLLFEEIYKETKVFNLFKDEETYTSGSLVRWLKRRKPDVIVVNGPRVTDWLKAEGWDTPSDVGVCRIDCVDGCEEAGMQASYESMGRAAMDMLSSSLERGEWGEPALRPSLSIPSVWHVGTSLAEVYAP